MTDVQQAAPRPIHTGHLVAQIVLGLIVGFPVWALLAMGTAACMGEPGLWWCRSPWQAGVQVVTPVCTVLAWITTIVAVPRSQSDPATGHRMLTVSWVLLLAGWAVPMAIETA